jgi:DNA-binding response OmpR family regulator
MLEEASHNVTVGVVDEDARYHASLLPVSIGCRTPFCFYGTAREALRRGIAAKHSFWLISVDLSEVSGFDLFEMLRDRLDGAPVCLVAQSYRREDEVRAYRAGAAMYACRPVEVVWLRQCLSRLRDPASSSDSHPTRTSPDC